MEIFPIKTRKINPPKDNLFEVLNNYCPELKEKDILLITSKVVSIHQGRCLPTKLVKNKDNLIKEEADAYIDRNNVPGKHAVLTIKNNTLIPSAGIDESNANQYYILWPNNPQKEAKKIYQHLKKRFSIKNIGVIITDSRTIPLRYGTIGISIGFYGIKPLKNYIGEKDIFGRKLKMTKSNIVDALAAAGVLVMGEGEEQTPMALIRNANFVKFTNRDNYRELLVPLKKDIYYSLLKNFHNL